MFSLHRLTIILWINIFLLMPTVKSAEQLSLVNGIFSRTITIESLDELAKTGEAKGSLKNLIRLSNQSPEEVSRLLNEAFEL